MIQTTFSYDTELCADSVEWCPIGGHEDFLALGTYQVDSSQEQNFSPSQRRGRLTLLKSHSDGRLQVLQQLDTQAILDMKWCPEVPTSQSGPLLAVAEATGHVGFYVLNSEDPGSLSKVVVTDLNDKTDSCRMALSLDFSRQDKSLLVVSDSMGGISVVRLDSTAAIVVDRIQGHDYEAWIAAFDCSSPYSIFSGGDDCQLKGHDIRLPSQATTHCFGKKHTMGVTSLLSDLHNEHQLLSGSYDETVQFWDTRNVRRSLQEAAIGGGVWRIRQVRHEEVSPDPDCCWSQYFGIAAMHHGFHLMDRSGSLSASYLTEHTSLAYGLDMRRAKSGGDPETHQKKGPCLWLASCSFYDHMLKLWSFSSDCHPS